MTMSFTLYIGLQEQENNLRYGETKQDGSLKLATFT